MAEGEAGGDGANDHENEGNAVDFFTAELVAEPAEEELAGKGAAEGDAVDGGSDVGREGAGFGGIWNMVIDSAEEFSDDGDTEEIVSVGEETHSSDDDCSEMVPLGFCKIECV